MPIIETSSLTRTYGRRRGIDSVSLSVPEGTLFGFLGPNGAGKTTAIRVMLGLLRPTRGSAYIFDLDCWSQSKAIKAELGYVPGDLRLYSWMNGGQALRIFGSVRGRDIATHGQELAEKFDLDLGVPVRKMSRGMRQKLGLILALAHKPRLLVLDEPTTTLDPLMQVKVHEHLRSLASSGHTVFFSSHSLTEVEQLCDHVAIIREGKLVADASLENLRQQAGHQVMIRWKSESTAAQLEPPAFLKLESRDAVTWKGILQGPVDNLIAWLKDHSIDDLTVERPDLETVFRSYYTREGGER